MVARSDFLHTFRQFGMTRIRFEELTFRSVEDAERWLVLNQNVGVLRNIRDKTEIGPRPDVRDEHGETVEF